MNIIEEERTICGTYCVKLRLPTGAAVIAHGKTREEAIDKARRAEPEPA